MFSTPAGQGRRSRCLAKSRSAWVECVGCVWCYDTSAGILGSVGLLAVSSGVPAHRRPAGVSPRRHRLAQEVPMDESTFDHLIRSFALPSRRAVFSALGAALVPALFADGDEDAL